MNSHYCILFPLIIFVIQKFSALSGLEIRDKEKKEIELNDYEIDPAKLPIKVSSRKKI